MRYSSTPARPLDVPRYEEHKGEHSDLYALVTEIYPQEIYVTQILFI